MSAFKRSDWNLLIQQVNAQAVACGYSEPLEEVTEGHIWSVEDVTQMRNALLEICANGPEFNEPLTIWSQALVDELQSAIVNCGCCDWALYELPYTWGLEEVSCTILGAPYDCYYTNLSGQTCGVSNRRYRVAMLYCSVLYRINGDLAPRKEGWMWSILDDSGVAESAIPDVRIFAVEPGSTITIEELDTLLLIGSVRELYADPRSGAMPAAIAACLSPPYTSEYYGIEIQPDVVCL